MHKEYFSFHLYTYLSVYAFGSLSYLSKFRFGYRKYGSTFVLQLVQNHISRLRIRQSLWNFNVSQLDVQLDSFVSISLATETVTRATSIAE